MYQSFYGFKEMPFNITPDPKFLYLSPTHQDALQHLKFGVQQKKGFIVLVGEVGCGKTTLCRRFLSELDPAHYDTALILNPRVTETQMLKAILSDLGETKIARSQADIDVTLRHLRDASADLGDFAQAVKENPTLLMFSGDKQSDRRIGK